MSRFRSMLASFAVTATLLLGAAASRAEAGDVSVFIVTWRGCEEACQGFQDYLTSAGHPVAFTLRDAAQDPGRLASILEEARAAEADLILSWGTSVTKGLAGDMAQLADPGFNHEIPQVFMIVADPVGSGIVASLDAPGRPNVTGTYNRMPETVTLHTIRSYLPGFRKLGLLYNENEPNSVLKRDELAALAAEEGFDLVALPIALNPEGLPLPEDIGPKMRALAAAGVDFLYVGSSSFLQANDRILGAAAQSTRIPVLSPYEGMVRDGTALISVAARYYEIGRLAGRQAEAILFGGKVPGELPVARMENFAVTLNLGVAREIGKFPPIELLQIAEIVE